MNNWKEFQGKETEELIKLIQDKQTNPFILESVFTALCFKFRERLAKFCIYLCKNRGYDLDTGYLIVNRAFKKYYRTRKFSINKGNCNSYDDNFLVYLQKIARNELNDFYNEEQKKINNQYYDGTEEIISEILNIDSTKLPPEQRAIHEVLLSFSHKHQVIYLTYKTHEKDGVNLPLKLRNKLRNYVGLKQPTIRTYKKEVIDKIESIKKAINIVKGK